MSNSYGFGKSYLVFTAMLLLGACGPRPGTDLNQGEANLSDLAVRDLWVEDFSDTSLSAIVVRSSLVPPDMTIASCHAQIAIPTDERIPYLELRHALTSSTDPFPAFYNDAYRQEVPLSTEQASRLATYDEQAEWLVQQSIIVSRYVELRLIDEILASFQRTLARYERLSDNINYWENHNSSPDSFNPQKEIVEALVTASRGLPSQLTSVKGKCFDILSNASGIRRNIIEEIVDNTWTQQPSPLPGISPFVPAELLNRRPDIAFAQDIISEAPVLDESSDMNFFGLSGTISSNEINLSSQPLARARLEINGFESPIELLEKQRLFMLVETWGEISTLASQDISQALGEYETLSQDIYLTEEKIKNLEQDLSDEFALFDSGRPRPGNIALSIREIQKNEIQIAGMRAEYAKLWAFLNVALGHGRSFP